MSMPCESVEHNEDHCTRAYGDKDPTKFCNNCRIDRRVRLKLDHTLADVADYASYMSVEDGEGGRQLGWLLDRLNSARR